MSRLGQWLRKPSVERNRLLVNKVGSLPFRIGASRVANLYLAYQPDSQAVFALHPEYKQLYEKFIASNRSNNAGDWPRFWSLILNLKKVLDEGIEGDMAELGVWRGNTSAILAHFAALHNRKVDLFDTFEGFDERDMTGIDADKPPAFANTSVDLVRNNIGNSVDVCQFHKGWFPHTLTPNHDSAKYCAVSLDCDLYDPMRSGLQFFYPRLSRGGILFLHDYSSGYWKGAKQAIDEFSDETGEMVVLMPDKSGSAFIRKHRE
jgi:hypothetical protein